MRKAALFSLLTDKVVLSELGGVAGELEATSPLVHRPSLDLLVNGREAAVQPGQFTATEAIILVKGRPALLVVDGKWEPIKVPALKKRVDAAASALESVIPRVGRVEILSHASDYVGTGWMIAPDVLVTNRHVADLFARRRGSGFSFRADAEGRKMGVRVDFLREFERPALRQARVAEVLFIEESSDVRPDMALVRLERPEVGLPEPIELDDRAIKFHDDVAVIGYPAEDPRNDTFVMRDIFKNVYGVKRMSPGWVSGVRQDGKVLEHDCTTLGGSSGSVVINLATGKACGLHFRGTYLENNSAVTAAALKQRLAQLGPRAVSVPVVVEAAVESDEEVEEKKRAARGRAAADLAGRTGYEPTFLGDGDLSVPLPSLPDELLAVLAPVEGTSDGELRYGHFSVKMRSDRRVAFFTAVNIDGNQLFNFPRSKDVWSPDPRLVDAGHQTDNELYAKNNLDRGHLVRRLDPVWGATRAEAEEAMDDTFRFTNCSPQHAKLNQKTWLSLEDYVLQNAATHGLRVTVFTGPRFQDTDRPYRGVPIPEEFWKVVVIVNEFTGRLSATGYVISQAAYLDDIEFVFGEFKTYQVAVSEIEAMTGLSFGDLASQDPLGSIESPGRREIGRAEDLVL